MLSTQPLVYIVCMRDVHTMCDCVCVYVYACMCAYNFLVGWIVMGSLVAILAVLAATTIIILLIVIYVLWKR